jgi:NAD(P)-dependent dehydrogenase (short-subunit alcohol dehydrogenase family)
MTSNVNKIALVTGGSRGLGKDMALRLAEKGFDIIITYQSRKSDAEKTIDEVNAIGQKAYALQLDVSESHRFVTFAKNLSELLKSELKVTKIDALVNNAGSGYHENFKDTTEKGFDDMVNIHLKAPFFLTQKLLPIFNDGGSIVNISSGLTRFSFPGYAAYATMKGGVETLSSYLAKELGERKIRVNTVAPGAIETDFGNGAIRDNKELNDMISSLTALGRVGLPDDLGSVVAFLCSDDSKWVNAQRIEVSGGIFV